MPVIQLCRGEKDLAYGWHVLLVLCLAVLVSGCGEMSTQASTVRGPEIQEQIIKATPTAQIVDNPVRLLVPSIQVDAAIEQVNILANGDLDTPQQHPLTDVGWYSGGPRPGEQGSAVIDGHLNGPDGGPAVFHRLADVKIGDEITVVMSSGKELHFHVTNVAAYPPKAAPLQTIFGDSGGNYLNLITCAGYWIPSEQQTSLRRVVYTTLT